MKKPILIYLLPISIFFLLGIFYFWPSPVFFWLAITIIMVILLLTIRELILSRLDEAFLFLGQIFVFVLAICFLPLFLSRSVLFFLIQAGLLTIFYFYLRNIYQLLYQPRFYRPYSLESTALLLNFIIIFLLVAELEILIFVYRLSPFIVLPMLFLFFFWLAFYYFNLKKTKDVLLSTFVLSLLLIQFCLGISFLPLSLHLNGLILAGLFVIIVKIWQKQEQKFL